MSLIACGSIHEGHEWFSDDSRGRQEIFVFGCSITVCEQFCRFAIEVAKISIKCYFMRSFFFCVFSSSEVLAKITSIRSKLPTAACWSREKKERKLWSQLTLRRKRLLLPDITDKSFTVFFVRWGVKFDRRVIRPLSYMCRRGERKACNRIVLWILISLL